MNVFRRAQTLSCHRKTHTHPSTGPGTRRFHVCPGLLRENPGVRVTSHLLGVHSLISESTAGPHEHTHNSQRRSPVGGGENADRGFATRRCLEGQETPIPKTFGVYSLILEEHGRDHTSTLLIGERPQKRRDRVVNYFRVLGTVFFDGTRSDGIAKQRYFLNG